MSSSESMPWSTAEFIDSLHNIDGRRLLGVNSPTDQAPDEVRQMPRIELANGQKMSVQASRYMCCTPDRNKGPFTAVELGFPEQPLPESFLPYAEEPENPTETVYNYVPTDILMMYIGSCGGVVGCYYNDEAHPWLNEPTTSEVGT